MRAGRRGAAALALAAALLLGGAEARAQVEAADVDALLGVDAGAALAGHVVVSLINAGAGAAAAYYATRGERTPTAVRLGFIFGGLGIAAGAFGLAHPSDAVKVSGAITLGIAVASSGLAIWNVATTRRLTVGVVPVAGGAAVTGTF